MARGARTSVITGSSSGIGLAIGRAFAARGWPVVLNGRDPERLLAAARDLGGPREAVGTVPGDAADDRVLEELLAAPRRLFSREVDLVVVNAGRGLAGSPLSTQPSDWEELLRTNVLGVLKLMRAAGQRLLALAEASLAEGPPRALDLVVIGSSVGRHVSPFSSVYGATKAAVASLAEALRRELGPKGIRVSLVEPGIVRSGFQRVAGYEAAWFESFAERIGPVLVPEDVARLVSFIVEQPPHVHVNDVVIRPTRQDYP